MLGKHAGMLRARVHVPDLCEDLFDMRMVVFALISLCTFFFFFCIFCVYVSACLQYVYKSLTLSVHAVGDGGAGE